MARVLVTGASGFIAKHIVRQLLSAGYEVRGSLRDLSRAGEVRAAIGSHDEDALTFFTADLLSDEGWAESMQEIDAVLHTASPFPMSRPNKPEKLIKPAVDGTRRVLRFAQAEGVRRVVVTSSCVAMMYCELSEGRLSYSESDWSDVGNPRITPYAVSKTLAERAAWDFVRDEAPDIALTTMNPALVLGPALDGQYGTSLRIVERILASKDPALPRFGFAVVDVRDVAAAHLAALERPESAGNRFLLAQRFIWFREMARILKVAYPERRIVTRSAPDFAVRLLATFSPAARSIVASLGRRDDFNTNAAEEILGISFRPAEEAVRTAADAIIRHAGR
ncbi:SDR family oxidoreductase [Algicella marina]|uniref:NAD-dependent epimerase/dehydratase family protein n=1 Tax=Algicella marina TaxID=2683284 RepID=A0A6P1T361_9RHOB|nr:aldehyde reductase [Algicella marina]QHQ36175.1 NAD-dependent epimerase/dehydratase family protein [Algicella marina]